MDGILHRRYKECYVGHPWFRYITAGRREGRCCPDALYINLAKRLIYIIEIKLRHTEAAWAQLRNIYYPVVATMYKALEPSIRLIEVVRWYDRSVEWPESPQLISSLEMVPPDRIGVHILNPQEYEG